MATYAREHPLRSILGMAVALAILALGAYAATANARSGGGARPDDRGGTTTVSDDPAGHDHGGANNVNDDPAGDNRGGANKGRENEQEFMVKLHELNDSSVSGTVHFKLKDGVLRVKIRARGLEPNQVHMQHIHGMANGSLAVCPPPEADLNGDGLISFAEGLPFFGPVLRGLTLQGLTIYPTADSRGDVRYLATFSGAELDGLQLMNVPLENRVVVLHGLTVNGAYSPSLPVTCGGIMATGANDDPAGHDGGDDHGGNRSSH